MIDIPRLVIAGASSGVGKTTITVGLIAALKAKGLSVQPFKCGPDYIDPTYHSLAARLACRNLDSWMVPYTAIIELFGRACQNVDLAVIEGVMGMYDGRTGADDTGSTAEIAKHLGAPVILVINVASTARSAGAIALGYKAFDKDVNLAGFILNGIGSQNHLRWTKEAIEAATDLPVIGHLPKNKDICLPERHLGLVPTPENHDSTGRIDIIRQEVEATMDLDALVRIAKTARPIRDAANHRLFPSEAKNPKIRLAVAYDEAFSFYYQDNLDLLTAWGATIVPVSPLHDRELPDVDGLYVGGGFPEMYAHQLSENSSFRQSIRRAAKEGLPVYCECGGLMYLSEGIVDFEGHKYPMVGIVPSWSVMQSKRVRMGYITVEALSDNILSKKGQVLRGHEFHWSNREETWDHAAYRVVDYSRAEGFADGNILASYVHLHFGWDISVAQRFIQSCEAWRNKSLIV